MSHRRHLNTKQFLERKLINSLKNNNFFSNLKNQKGGKIETQLLYVIARASSVPLAGIIMMKCYLIYLPSAKQK